MSRPYVNINSVSYNSTNDVLTLDITALRLRGASTLSIGGLTASGETQTITLYIRQTKTINKETTQLENVLCMR